MIGRNLSRYRIVSKLGEGGMGAVYKAEDTELGRQVAVKVLPEEVAADAERLERFRREARAVAALNHPNIVTIHSVEEADGLHLLTMELVEGKSLDRVLPPAGFPVDELFPLAIQVADAVAAAHDRGIVHRDLKPANVMVNAEGRVKVLDFGLAKLAETQTDGGKTELMTQEGMILGTVPYMSPEQVQGLDLDHRSDIFSMGVLFYEMATGERPFQGDNPASVISAVLKDQPAPLTELNADLPNHLGRIVRRCIEKQPQRRFQSAREVQLELEGLAGELTGTTASTATAIGAGVGAPLDRPGPAEVGARSRPVRRFSWAKLAAVLAIGGLLGFVAATLLDSPTPYEPPKVRTLTVSGSDSEPAASPDGRLIAFTSQRDGTPRIWIKQLATGGEEPVTEGPDRHPRFSPDGASLIFAREVNGKISIYRQGLIGGQAREVIHRAVEADWSPDGSKIAFTRQDSENQKPVSYLGVTDGQGGAERILLKEVDQLSAPRWSPDGSKIAVAHGAFGVGTRASGLLLVDAEIAEVEFRLYERGVISAPAWLDNESLIYAWSDSLTGDQGDRLSRVRLHNPRTGRKRNLFWAEDLFPFLGSRLDSTTVDRIGSNSLVFHSGSIGQKLSEVHLGGEGPIERSLTSSEGIDRQPAYSPDGRQVVFASNRSGNLDIWQLSLETGDLRQLTDDIGQDYDPSLTPDGSHLLWSSDRSGHFEIWIANADGSGARQLSNDGFDAENPTMSPDGEWVVYWSSDTVKRGVWKIRSDGSDATQLTEGQFGNSEVSPDGRYVAYVHQQAEFLQSLILVTEVATGKTVPFEIEVAAPLGAENIVFGRCRWLPDGSGIAFVGADEDERIGIFAQDFVPGEDTSSSRRKLAGFYPDRSTESFGISPDGKTIAISMLNYTWRLMLAEGVQLRGP